MKNLSVKLVLSGAIVCLAVLMLAIVGSCGKSRTSAPSINVEPASKSGHSVLSRRNIPPIEELLEELDALDKPPEVDSALWASLKADMREWLLETFGDGKGVSRYPGDDEDPPVYLGTNDYVKARKLVWKAAGAYGKLEWRYVNDGDYNQDSQVSIADITPLAIYYGQQVDDEDEELNTIRELIDEDDEDPLVDGDGWVDADDLPETPDDLETIARCYGVVVAEYQVFGRDDGESWTPITTIPFSSGSHEAGFRDTFEYELASEDYRYYKVRALDGDGEPWYHEQAESNVVESDPIDLAPKIEWVKPRPIAGMPGDIVDRIHAKVSGATPFNYSWDFAGHLIPNTSNEAEVEDGEITGPYADDWDASLTVTNAYGEDTRNIHFIVTEEPVAPEIHLIWMEYMGVKIEAGDPGWVVTFYAEVTGSTPRDYSWNFGGGATPNTSTLENPTVILGDARIESYNGTLAVSNDAGAVLEGFQYYVGRHVDIGDITPLTDGLSGEEKTFQVTFSGTPPIHYEWNFGGGAEPNEFSGSVGEPGEIGPFIVEVDVTLLNGLPYDQHLTAAYDDIPGNEARTYGGSIAAWNDVFNEALSKPFILRVTARWHIEDIDNATRHDSGIMVSLDFNSVWCPAISFHKNHQLWFAEYDGVTWSTELVDQDLDTGIWSSLEFDSLDRPNISYTYTLDPVHQGPSDLRFCFRDSGGVWQLDEVDTEDDVGRYNSLELFPGDRPAISYLDRTNHALKYAERIWDPENGWQWSIETIVGGDAPGPELTSVTGYTSLDLRNDEDPIIAYTSNVVVPDPPNDPKWVSRAQIIERLAGEWQWPETIEEGVFPPCCLLYTSLGLDSTGLPKVAYHRDAIVRDLRFAQLVGEEWDPETVDDEEGANDKVGEYASLALDDSDRPLIGYYLYRDLPEYELKAAYYLPGVVDESDWVLESLPTAQEPIIAVSLALDSDENPAMAYVHQTGGVTYWLSFAHFW